MTEYHRHKRYGHQYDCRDCKRVEGRERYRANRERGAAKAREWRDNHPEAARETWQRYRAANADRVHAYDHAYRHAMTPERRLRRRLLEKARTNHACNHFRNRVRRGEYSVQPCEVCGHAEAQGHHDNYNRPFEVRWLCVQHHAAWHSEHEPVYVDGWQDRLAALLMEHGLAP